jgi:WD40 repeat protein
MEALLMESAVSGPVRVKLAGERGTSQQVDKQVKIPTPRDFLAASFPSAAFSASMAKFFPTKINNLVVVYAVETSSSCALVWDLQSPRKPSRVLYSEAAITSLLVPASNEQLVIAGTVDGAILLWDLQESSVLHTVVKTDSHKYALRRPTYSSEGLGDDLHTSGVTHLAEIPAPPGAPFQIVSVDDTGVLVSWTVMELPTADLAGSEVDLGLRIGGKFKLVKGHSLSITQTFKLRTSGVTAFALDPSDGQKFIVACASRLCHGSRFTGKVSPAFYEPSNLACPTSLSVSPSDSWRYFLSAFSCGSVALWDKHSSLPLSVWHSVVPRAVSVHWEPAGLAHFYLLDSACQLHLWDLVSQSSVPTTSLQLSSQPWVASDLALPQSNKQQPLCAFVTPEVVEVSSLV